MINLSLLKKLIPASIKNYVKAEIRNLILDEINNNQKAKQHKEVFDSRPLSPISINPWYVPVIYEPSVNLTLRDLCKPEDVAFDVGCHDGALTLLMSRLVGPKGVVCGFEANPNILESCTHNLVCNGCNNVFLTHSAVWKKSDEVLNLYVPPDNWQAASLVTGPAHYQPTPVITVALDDFITSKKLEPQIIKMDIEGVEFEALQGTVEYIKSRKPFFILEQSTEDGRCIDFLQEQGYVALDLSNYKWINSIKDYPDRSVIRNVLFSHREKINLTPYNLEMTPKLFNSWKSHNFTFENNISTLKGLHLSSGRYLILTDFDAQDSNDLISLCIHVNNYPQINYIGAAQWIQHSYRDSILNIDKPSDITIAIKLWNPKDLATELKVKLHEVTIYQFW